MNHEEWLAAAASDQPDIDRLLGSLCDGSYADSLDRLDRLARWPRQQRVGVGLLGLLRAAPWHATGSKPWWCTLFALLVHHGDTDLAEAVADSVEQATHDINGATMRKWLGEQIPLVAEAMRAPHGASVPKVPHSVAEALESDDLALLLELWRYHRVATLGAVVLARSSTPSEAKKLKQAAWLALAQERDPANLPLLLAQAEPRNVPQGVARLRELCTWPADPRIGGMAAEFFLENPVHLTTPFGYFLLATLLRHGDDNAVAILRRGDPERWWIDLGRSALEQWQVDRLVPLPDEAVALLHAALPDAPEPEPESTESPHFSVLRAVLYEPPTTANWIRLMECFDGWPPGEELNVAVDYARPTVESWPAELRRMPAPWVAESERARSRWTGWHHASIHPAASLASETDDPTVGRRANNEELLAVLERCGRDERIRHLDLQTYADVSVTEFEALASSPLAPRLESLVIGEIRGDSDGVGRTLTERFGNLRDLEFDAEDVAAALRAVHLPRLKRLDLTTATVVDGTVAALCSLNCRLTALEIRHSSKLETALFKELVEAPLARELEELHLDGCGVDQQGFQLLWQTSMPLRVLRCWRNYCREEGLIGAEETLRHLEWLDLADNELGNAAAAILASADMPRLRRLNLRRNRITNTGIKQLAASPNLQQLSYLNLESNRFKDAGGKALAAVEFDAIDYLNLSYNPIGTEAAMTIANNPRHARLERYDLFDAGFYSSSSDNGGLFLRSCNIRRPIDRRRIAERFGDWSVR